MDAREPHQAAEFLAAAAAAATDERRLAAALAAMLALRTACQSSASLLSSLILLLELLLPLRASPLLLLLPLSCRLARSSSCWPTFLSMDTARRRRLACARLKSAARQLSLPLLLLLIVRRKDLCCSGALAARDCRGAANLLAALRMLLLLGFALWTMLALRLLLMLALAAATPDGR
jgi:hypothetical protein